MTKLNFSQNPSFKKHHFIKEKEKKTGRRDQALSSYCLLSFSSLTKKNQETTLQVFLILRLFIKFN